MKLSIFAIVAMAALGLAGAAWAQACERPPLLVRSARVWTPDRVLEHRDVLARDGKVVAVAPAGSIRAEGAVVLDGEGRTLLPGLIDAHVHFGVPGGLPPTAAGPRRDHAEITGRQMLRSGVTSARLHLSGLEAGSQLRRRSQDDCNALPRLQAGGPGLGAVETDAPNFWGAKTPDEARAKVTRIADAGFDWVSVHDAHKLPAGVAEAIVQAARARGLKVFASGERHAEIQRDLALKPDTLDYILHEGGAYEAAALQAVAARRDLVLVPTVGIYDRFTAFKADPALIDQPAFYEFMKPGDQAYVSDKVRRDLVDNHYVKDAQGYASTVGPKLRQLIATGAPMAMGTDVGSVTHFQAGAMWQELRSWRAAGATPVQALTAATRGGAMVLGDPDAGTIRPGAHADLVLYRGDILDGDFDPARVEAVAKGGVLFVRDGRWVGSLPPAA